MGKETFNLYILIISRNGDSKIKEVEPAQPVQMNIYQSNTYRKDLSRLHFHDGARVQIRQQVLDQQSYIPVFVTYQHIQVAIRSTSIMTAVLHARPYGIFITKNTFIDQEWSLDQHQH